MKRMRSKVSGNVKAAPDIDDDDNDNNDEYIYGSAGAGAGFDERAPWIKEVDRSGYGSGGGGGRASTRGADAAAAGVTVDKIGGSSNRKLGTMKRRVRRI